MAVAVKNTRETTSSRLLDRLSVSIVLGILYVLGSLGIVFPLLATLWWRVLGFNPGMAVWWILLVAAEVVVAGGLAFVGLRLLGPHPTKGLKAGIAVGVIGILLIALITRWIGALIEGYMLTSSLPGPTARIVGIVLTVAVGVLLLIVGGRYLLGEQAASWLGILEDQGWFTTAPFKRGQGARVRRGTILGVLILAGCGIFLLARSLEKQGGDWLLNIPFTEKIAVTDPGDNPFLYVQKSEEVPAQVDRFALRDLNRKFENDFVKVKDPGTSRVIDLFEHNQIVSKSEFDSKQKAVQDAHNKLIDEGRPEDADREEQVPSSVPVVPAKGEAHYAAVVLLPHLAYTLPLLVSVATLWLAWRLVNVPVFGDFLIATEAELNKVSWTTRKRLYQDTIVVLVTVLVLTAFLFLADLLWSQLLKGIGVLQQPPAATAPEKPKW